LSLTASAHRANTVPVAWRIVLCHNFSFPVVNVEQFMSSF
jgi:hypothetical protein